MIDLKKNSPVNDAERFTYYDMNNREEENTRSMSNMRLDMGYSSTSPNTAFREIFQGDAAKKGNQHASSSPFGFEVDQSPYSIISSSSMNYNPNIQTMTYNSASTAASYDSSIHRTRGGLEKEIYENFGLFGDMEFNNPHRSSPTSIHPYKHQQSQQQQRLPPKHPTTSTLQMMKTPIVHSDDIHHYPENTNQWLTGPDFAPLVNENISFPGTANFTFNPITIISLTF
jgi:hypothetical protein